MEAASARELGVDTQAAAKSGPRRRSRAAIARSMSRRRGPVWVVSRSKHRRRRRRVVPRKRHRCASAAASARVHTFREYSYIALLTIL